MKILYAIWWEEHSLGYEWKWNKNGDSEPQDAFFSIGCKRWGRISYQGEEIAIDIGCQAKV